MSLFPAYFGPRKRAENEPAPVTEPESDNESRADIFNLIPPSASEKYERPKDDTPAGSIENPGSAVNSVHAVKAIDLTRLSIDDGGNLYWDGKPVEVRRRLLMSREQVIGASAVAFFVVVAAIGSAIQATATLSDWACRTGWATQCGSSAPASPSRPRPEIPA